MSRVELLSLTIERDVLEWVLGDRQEPTIPLRSPDSGLDEAGPTEA